MTEQHQRASAPSLARSSVINVFGQIVPVAVAFAAIPFLLNGLGRDKFGLLTLAWAAVGWFSVFDLGLGRATTHVVASGHGTGTQRHTRSMALMTIAALFVLGCIAAAAAAAATPFLISDVLKVPAGLHAEAETAFILLSVSLPFVLGSSGARGALEGLGRFDWVNAIRIPSAVLLSAVPVALLAVTHDLRVIVATITLNRICAFTALYIVALRALGPKTTGERAPRDLVRRTMAYAGWTGATNAFGTVLAWGYLDRYVVGAVLSVGSVALYATPFEIVTKLLLYPMSLMAVFFPTFVRASHLRDGQRRDLEARALGATVLPLLPLVMCGVAASGALLTLYVGSTFADEATTVTQLLLLGTLCACAGQVPFTMLQAHGRSDLTAKRHVVQLIIYIPVVIGLTSWFGIEGTAIAWLLWASSDSVLLFYMAHHYAHAAAAPRSWPSVCICGVVMLVLAILISNVTHGWSQISAGALLGLLGAGYLWFILPEADKQALKSLLGRRRLPAMQT